MCGYFNVNFFQSKRKMERPPPVEVVDASVRSDLLSNDVIACYPELPYSPTWGRHSEFVKKRTEFLDGLDRKASSQTFGTQNRWGKLLDPKAPKSI
jgi:hypothetical protein